MSNNRIILGGVEAGRQRRSEYVDLMKMKAIGKALGYDDKTKSDRPRLKSSPPKNRAERREQKRRSK
jgi:hypothetical protein